MHSIDHSGSQIEGDEYLQPKSRAPISISSLSHSPPSTSMKFWPSGSHITSDESCAPQNQHNWDRERMRYAQAHGLDPNSLRHMSDGSSIKYCDESLKMFKTNDLGSDEFDSGRSQAQVGTLKLQLPVDEDDYLMPSPQQVQPSTTYVDFGDGSRSSENVSANSCANMYKNYSDLCKTNIDNPEYLMSNDTTPSQTVGIPTVSELVQANCNNNRDVGSSNNGISHTAHPYLPQKSSEEESDHEYYNDYDRLKRELQPLHKSETTV